MILTSTRTRRPGLLAVLLALLCVVSVTEADAATLVVSGVPGTRITVNDSFAGTLPLPEPIQLGRGTHVVVCSLQGCATRVERLDVENESARLRLNAYLEPFRLRRALTSSLIVAGGGQRYLERDRSGWILTGAEVGGLLAALYGELAFTNFRNDYEVAHDAYLVDINAADAETHRLEAQQAWDDMESAETLRRTGLVVAGAAIVISVLDCWLRFPWLPESVKAETGAGMLPLDTPAVASLDGRAGLHAGWRIAF